MKRYYSLYKQDNKADIYIYGDITSWDWSERDISSYTLSKRLQGLDDVDEINIYINSYGGEVAEGLAIYNALKRHPAKITTYADGFACSIASVIFSAGEDRVISNASMLMIHNALTYAAGNANDFRKQADDLEKITQAAINAYMENVNIEEDVLKELLDNETWLTADECIEMGFANKLVEEKEKTVATQNVRNSIAKRIIQGPEKQVVANVNFDEEELEEMVEKAIAKLKEELEEEGNKDEGSNKKQNKDNKPLNIMSAFFNKEED